MTLETIVIATRRVPRGETVGYGGAWRAARDSRLAIIAAGYGDGLPWGLPAGTAVCIAGAQLPLVGARQMREEADLAYAGVQRSQSRQRRREFLRPEAEAIHPGVDLQPGDEAVRQRRPFEKHELLFLVHDEVEVQQRGLGELRRVEDAFQQHDRLSNAGGPQPACLLEARDGKGIGIG